MSIGEISAAKLKAENEIIDIINQLEKETECEVIKLKIIRIEEDGFGLRSGFLRNELDILLLVP